MKQLCKKVIINYIRVFIVYVTYYLAEHKNAFLIYEIIVYTYRERQISYNPEVNCEKEMWGNCAVLSKKSPL